MKNFILQVQQVSKCFNGVLALDKVSLNIERGERVALIGSSGSGKSTLVRLLNLTLRPTSGRISFNNVDVASLGSRELRGIKTRIGTIYQQHNLVSRLSVHHNVLSGRLGSWSLLKSISSLVRSKNGREVVELLDRVGIAEKAYSKTYELSGGQQQRVAIARVLFQDPEIILADEPVSSVDSRLAAEIMELLIDMNENLNRTLLVVLHSVHLARSYFNRIIGMKEGEPLFDCPAYLVTDELLNELYSNGSDQKDVSQQKIAENPQKISCQPLL